MRSGGGRTRQYPLRSMTSRIISWWWRTCPCLAPQDCRHTSRTRRGDRIRRKDITWVEGPVVHFVPRKLRGVVSWVVLDSIRPVAIYSVELHCDWWFSHERKSDIRVRGLFDKFLHVKGWDSWPICKWSQGCSKAAIGAITLDGLLRAPRYRTAIQVPANFGLDFFKRHKHRIAGAWWALNTYIRRTYQSCHKL